MEKLWKTNISVQIRENHTQNNVGFGKKSKVNKVRQSDIKVGVINCQVTHLHVSSYNRAFHDYRSFLHVQSDQGFLCLPVQLHILHIVSNKKSNKLAQTLKHM